MRLGDIAVLIPVLIPVPQYPARHIFVEKNFQSQKHVPVNPSMRLGDIAVLIPVNCSLAE
jgi:hypothetical protein